jgi:hypothetical protein
MLALVNRAQARLEIAPPSGPKANSTTDDSLEVPS